VSKFLKYPLSFLGKKNEKKFNDLGAGHDLTKFAKILMPKFLQKNNYIY
jgi:hypothetical protein